MVAGLYILAAFYSCFANAQACAHAHTRHAHVHTRVHVYRGPPFNAGSPGYYTDVTWTFPSTARVLGIQAKDNECGAACGGVTFACFSADPRAPWHGFSAGSPKISAFGSNSRDAVRDIKWSTVDASNDVKQWPDPILNRGSTCFSRDADWWESQPDYSESNSRISRMRLCQDSESALNSGGWIEADENNAINEKPRSTYDPSDRTGSRAPYYWWFRVSI